MKNKLLIVGMLLSSTVVFADGNKKYVLPKNYVAECGSCHVAYPGELLPKNTWKAINSDLKNHFGNDASIDEKSLAEINKYLMNTTTYRKAEETKDHRITSAKWFIREHREANAPTKTNFANCMACHTKAEVGNYSLIGYKGKRD